MIGDEGFLGVPVVFGARTQQYAATVQMAGSVGEGWAPCAG